VAAVTRADRAVRAPYLAYFGDQGAAEGEEDVAVLVAILEDGVALVIFELPAGGIDGFGVAVEAGIAGDEVEDWLRVRLC